MDEKNENECENEEKAGDKSSLSLCFSLCLCDPDRILTSSFKPFTNIVFILYLVYSGTELGTKIYNIYKNGNNFLY